MSDNKEDPLRTALLGAASPSAHAELLRKEMILTERVIEAQITKASNSLKGLHQALGQTGAMLQSFKTGVKQLDQQFVKPEQQMRQLGQNLRQMGNAVKEIKQHTSGLSSGLHTLGQDFKATTLRAAHFTGALADKADFSKMTASLHNARKAMGQLYEKTGVQNVYHKVGQAMSANTAAPRYHAESGKQVEPMQESLVTRLLKKAGQLSPMDSTEIQVIRSRKAPYDGGLDAFYGGKIAGLSPEETLAFANRVKYRENRKGQLGAVNWAGYTGNYQFGAEALAATGFIDPKKLPADHFKSLEYIDKKTKKRNINLIQPSIRPFWQITITG